MQVRGFPVCLSFTPAGLLGDVLTAALASVLQNSSFLPFTEDFVHRMLELAEPLPERYFPGHGPHSDLTWRERENRVIGEVLEKIAEEHPEPDKLLKEARGDLPGLRVFLQE